MKKVLYLLNDELIISLWSNKTRVACYHFNYSEDDDHELHQYFESENNLPVSIVIDITEEDFKTESLPIAYLNNKTKLISRFKNRLYPDSHYVHVEPIRLNIKEKNKSDYRFSAITKPLILIKLIGLLNHHNIPIAGVWSAAIVSDKLSNLFKSETKHNLLVSSPKKGYIRQSYFYNNQLVFSRLIHIESSAGVPVWNSILEEIQQTKKFLFNQRMIGFNDALSIDVIDSKHVCNELIAGADDDLGKTLSTHTVAEVASKLNINNHDFEYSDTLLSFIVSRMPSWSDHYGLDNIKHLHSHQLRSNGLLVTTMALIITSLILSQYYFMEGLHFKQLLIQTEKELIVQNNLYNNEFLSIEDSLNKAEFMRSAVLTIEEIQNEKNVNPLRFYISLSELLSSPDFRILQLLDLRWEKQSSFTSQSEASDSQNSMNQDAPPMFDVTESQSNEDSSMMNNAISPPTNIIDSSIRQMISLEGEIIGDTHSMIYIKDTLDKFSLALTKKFNLDMITVKRLPIDIRSEVSLEGGSTSEFSIADKRFIFQFVVEG